MLESKVNVHYQREFPSCGQGCQFSRECSSAYDKLDHPLVANLSGEALNAYNEAYEEPMRTDDSGENSPSIKH